MIACVACKTFSLKRVSAEDARKGLGHCEPRAKFIRHHATKERDCDRFDREDDAVVAARLEWLQKQESA